MEELKEEFISDFDFLEMKHLIVGIELHGWFIPCNFAGETVDECSEDVVMDLADGDWDKLIDGEADEAVRVISKHILHVVRYFGDLPHFVQHIDDDQGGVFAE